MASKPIEIIYPKYPNYRLGVQSEIYQKTNQDLELKIQFLKETGFYWDNMSVEEINLHYEEIATQPKSNNVEKKIITSQSTSTEIVEKKLPVIAKVDTKVDIKPTAIPITSAPKVENKPSIDSSISTEDMKNILKLYNCNCDSKSSDEIKELYQLVCITEQTKPLVDNSIRSISSTSSNSSNNSNQSKNTTENSAREIIRKQLSQLVTDDTIRNNLLTLAGNPSNIPIDSVTDFILSLYQKNGGVSDIQNEFLLNSGYFGLQVDNKSSPFGNIAVVDNGQKYNITNLIENKGNGACGINWISAALRAGLIKLGEVETNLFGINETSDNDNWGFRIKISNMVETRKSMISRANKSFTFGEGILSALSENLFTREFLNEGYYIKSEEIYIIAFMLNIKVKILAWENNHAVVHYNQTRGINEEPVYLYLWNSHYYLMKRTE